MDAKACERLGGDWNPRTTRCRAFYTYEVEGGDLVLYGKNDRIVKRYDIYSDIISRSDMYPKIVDMFLDEEGLEAY